MAIDSPAFRNIGELLSLVKRRGSPPEGEEGWLPEASLYRLGFDTSQVRRLIQLGIFDAIVDDPKNGMGVLWLRTHCNTEADKANLLPMLPAARKLFDPSELEELMKDPVKRQEVIDAMMGFARLGGDLSRGD